MMELSAKGLSELLKGVSAKGLNELFMGVAAKGLIRLLLVSVKGLNELLKGLGAKGLNGLLRLVGEKGMCCCIKFLCRLALMRAGLAAVVRAAGMTRGGVAKWRMGKEWAGPASIARPIGPLLISTTVHKHRRQEKVSMKWNIDGPCSFWRQDWKRDVGAIPQSSRAPTPWAWCGLRAGRDAIEPAAA